jgi:DNA-binding MarR family transcriptional regulator
MTAALANPDAKSSSFEALKRFRLILKAIQQHSQWVETKCGLSSAQLWLMSEIAKNPGSKVTELANALSIHHSTACSLLDKLAKKGLILRERISRDQRVVTIRLTEKGELLFDEAPAPAQGILQQALFELPDPILGSLTKNLDALINQMQIKDEDAAMQPINLNPKNKRSSSKPS